MKGTFAALALFCAPGLMFGQITDAELSALIAYGQQWKSPDRLYRDALPSSHLARIAGMRSVRFMTDRARIALEACRAKLLLKPFNLAIAREMFHPGRLHAVLEVESATAHGAMKMHDDYGGENINLILMEGEDMLQPSYVSAARSGTDSGVAFSQVTPIGKSNIYTVNTLGLMPGYLIRSFVFELSAPLRDRTKFILVRSDGKKQPFETSIAIDRPLSAEAGVQLRYPSQSAVKQGKAAELRFSLSGKAEQSPRIVVADSIWRAPTVVGQQPTKLSDVPGTVVFRYKQVETAGVYELDLPTDGLSPGRYDLQVRIGDATRTLSFGVR